MAQSLVIEKAAKVNSKGIRLEKMPEILKEMVLEKMVKGMEILMVEMSVEKMVIVYECWLLVGF